MRYCSKRETRRQPTRSRRPANNTRRGSTMARPNSRRHCDSPRPLPRPLLQRPRRLPPRRRPRPPARQRPVRRRRRRVRPTARSSDRCAAVTAVTVLTETRCITRRPPRLPRQRHRPPSRPGFRTRSRKNGNSNPAENGTLRSVTLRDDRIPVMVPMRTWSKWIEISAGGGW